MMKLSSKYLYLLIIALLVFLVSGCGSNNDDKESSESDKKTAEESKEKIASEAVAPKETESESQKQDNNESDNKNDDQENTAEANGDIKIGETTYTNLMNESKFQHWIDVAKKHNAILYGVKNSGNFVILKNKEPLVFIGTGTANALPKNAAVLIDIFSDRGEDSEAIANGIKQVIETGEAIHVGPPDIGVPGESGYSISLKEGMVWVMW